MCKEQTLSQVLVLNPGCYLGCASLLGLSCRSAAPTAVTMLRLTLFIALNPAIAIDGIVAQASKHTWSIYLCSQVFHTCRWMGLAAVHSSLLAAMSFVQHIGDQMLLIEWLERGKNPGCIAL